MNKELTQELVEKITNEETKELIMFLKNNNINDEVIIFTIFGIGTHTNYYNVLMNRLINNGGIINNEVVKVEVQKIFKEIDRTENM